LPCRIPRRAREAPVDDRQAQPAPAREKRFHACGEPRRILRNPDGPVASMSEWVSASTNQSRSRRPGSPSPSLACSRRLSASETPSNSWAWLARARSGLPAPDMLERSKRGDLRFGRMVGSEARIVAFACSTPARSVPWPPTRPFRSAPAGRRSRHGATGRPSMVRGPGLGPGPAHDTMT
jgi:hypothetical protein